MGILSFIFISYVTTISTVIVLFVKNKVCYINRNRKGGKGHWTEFYIGPQSFINTLSHLLIETLRGLYKNLV